ncbi:PUR family DNA/RNA-binding protein [Haoranjiania flava]|uniref:PUR family DNA/RNA-binding protein n=1 Tax=Haoranjiania flava TaxID=1856322 RepID=A0AAE3IP05_9BACT|nr:PUR family DNA/RNA-binding protein [Haoranjiania flava]MCU7693826.1 PUR family DNA/RNA-binding protein [Haoranjiania flava]
MAYENNDKKQESVYSKRIKAGKRRTYFFDVRETRSNDYYLTITESRKRFNDDGYDRHKVFLYKEDFNKFLKALIETIEHVKTELMPDFDFDAFNHEYEEGEYTPAEKKEPVQEISKPTEEQPKTDETVEEPPVEYKPSASSGDNLANEHVDKW